MKLEKGEADKRFTFFIYWKAMCNHSDNVKEL